jgi:hypothetical protein
MSINYLNKNDLFPAAVGKLKNTEVVLDIGCGIRPQKLIVPRVHICCDPCAQYVEKLQEKLKNEYDRSYIVIQCGWEEAVNIFPEKSADSVFLLDVIEHLEKEKALEFIKKTEKIARSQVVIFTTLGFIPQRHPDGKDAWGLDGGKWQEHKSGWQSEDFGDSWDIFIAKDYHSRDNLGNIYEKPYGAIIAIKNLSLIDEGKEIMETSRSLSILNRKLGSILKAEQIESQKLKENLNIAQNKLDEIYRSRGWKMINQARRFKNHIFFK